MVSCDLNKRWFFSRGNEARRHVALAARRREVVRATLGKLPRHTLLLPEHTGELPSHSSPS